MSSIVNPQAAVIVFNYENRLGADGNADPQSIGDVNLLTSSVMYINTSKDKARPSGSFEVGLAPRFNWTAHLTPGSWIVILMTRNTTIDEQVKSSASEKQVKLIGRIDEVRQVVDVDQDTGARTTHFVMSGRDWGAVFDSLLYIDPLLAVNSNDQLSDFGHATRLLFDNFVHDWFTKDRLPDIGDVMRGIINLWGSPLPKQSSLVKGMTSGALSTSSGLQFMMPGSLVRYLGLKNSSGKATTSISELITLYEGVLKSLDSSTSNGYSGNPREAFVAINPNSVYGTHTFWQLLVEHCNPILNELVTDLRWENGSPVLALYRRIHPFNNRKKFLGSENSIVSKLVSPFKYVRRTVIPLTDVITINAGTNWGDRVNFIQIMPIQQLVRDASFSVQIKTDSQTRDDSSINRDGFKPLMIASKYLPYADGDPHPQYLELTNWKYIIREWFFNTHLLLNGSVMFIGQDSYIQVGDNIMIDSQVLGATKNINKKHKAAGDSFLLAHVESIQHQFKVSQNGARSFYTVVKFVRGMITDRHGNPINGNDITVDFKTGEMTAVDERNQEVFGTSTPLDPDQSKIKGT